MASKARQFACSVCVFDEEGLTIPNAGPLSGIAGGDLPNCLNHRLFSTPGTESRLIVAGRGLALHRPLICLHEGSSWAIGVAGRALLALLPKPPAGSWPMG